MDKVSKKSWPSTLASPEKLIALGPDALTDIELLAQFGSFDKLMTADHRTPSATYGLGISNMYAAAGDWRNGAAHLRSHLMREDAMTSPDMARRYLQQILVGREREVFVVMFFDNRNRLINHQELFHGTVNSVEVHPREIVRTALKINGGDYFGAQSSF